jgi:hypothetical protein
MNCKFSVRTANGGIAVGVRQMQRQAKIAKAVDADCAASALLAGIRWIVEPPELQRPHTQITACDRV